MLWYFIYAILSNNTSEVTPFNELDMWFIRVLTRKNYKFIVIKKLKSKFKNIYKKISLGTGIYLYLL